MLWTAPPRHESAIEVGAVRTSDDSEEPGHANDYDRWSRYREVSVQVHGVDADGNVVVRRQLKRRCVLTFFQKLPPCLVGCCGRSTASGRPSLRTGDQSQNGKGLGLET